MRIYKHVCSLHVFSFLPYFIQNGTIQHMLFGTLILVLCSLSNRVLIVLFFKWLCNLFVSAWP